MRIEKFMVNLDGRVFFYDESETRILTQHNRTNKVGEFVSGNI